MWKMITRSLTQTEALQILGVPPGASTKQIRAAYIKRVKIAHPDLGGNPEEFKKLAKAFEIVKKGSSIPAPSINPFTYDYTQKQYYSPPPPSNPPNKKTPKSPAYTKFEDSPSPKSLILLIISLSLI